MKLFGAVFLCVPLALFTSCRGGEDPALSRPDTVIIGTSDVSGMYPGQTSLEHLIFSPLVFFIDYVEREPGLAHTWEDSPDTDMAPAHRRPLARR